MPVAVGLGADGKATANGSDGFSGHNPADGGEGGKVEVYGYRNVINNGVLSANGGNGGTNPAVESGPVVDMVDANGNPVLNGKGNILQQQASFGQNGGQGGNGGSVLVSYGVKGGEIINNGAIEVKGGNGGDGQIALSEANLGGPGAHVAIGGNGGNAGNGGYVEFVGGIGAKLPSQVTLDNVNVSGGSGGAGGDAKVLNDCGCATPGSKGACGAPGQLKYSVTDIPGKPPTPPLFPPYPKEYPRLGEGLPSGIGPVLSYNRSIFMARAPLPIIKKKPVPPPPEVVEAPPPPKPAPPPPQKKATVRGFW